MEQAAYQVIVDSWEKIIFGLATAYIVEYNVDENIRGTDGGTFYVRVPINCYGEGLPAWGPSGRHSSWMAQYAGGAAPYFPNYEVNTIGGKTKFEGMWQDVRSLELLLAGCCPLFPELGEDENLAYDV